MIEVISNAEPRLESRTIIISRLLLIAVVIYNVVLVITGGNYEFWSLITCIAVIVLTLAAALLPWQGRRARDRQSIMEIAGIGLIIQASLMMLLRVSIYFVPRDRWDIHAVVVLLTALTLVGSSLLCLRPWVGKRGMIIMALLHVILGCWIVWLSPKPFIDVWIFHQDSAAALMNGENPYAITFPNPYLEQDGSPSPFYSPEVQQNGRVLFGFPYPPLSLFMSLPSYVLTGESRYAHATAFALSGLLVGTLSGGRVARAAGVLLLTTPASWHIICASWTEPFLLLSLVVAAICAVRCPKWLPVAVGVFLAMKQYTVIYIPLLFLILPRPLAWGSSLRFLGIMVLTGAVVSLPLALWDWGAFWNSAVVIQMKQPFRFDALSFLALFANAQPDGFVPPGWWSMIAFVLLIPTWAVLLWRMPRNISGFVLGVAVTSIIFLFFNRQAFLNYHTFAAGAMLLAVACMEATDLSSADATRAGASD